MTYKPPPQPSRPVKPTTCPHCHAPTLTGLTDGVGPHTTTIDTQALTPQGELQALTNGQQTHAHQEPFELQTRDQWSITHLPPQTPAPTNYTIHAQHKCDAPTHDHYPPPPPKTKTIHTTPPF